MPYEDVATEESIAHALAALVFSTEMSAQRRLEFKSLIAQVKRAELTLDELYSEARENVMLISRAPNVVHVDFAKER